MSRALFSFLGFGGPFLLLAALLVHWLTPRCSYIILPTNFIFHYFYSRYCCGSLLRSLQLLFFSVVFCGSISYSIRLLHFYYHRYYYYYYYSCRRCLCCCCCYFYYYKLLQLLLLISHACDASMPPPQTKVIWQEKGGLLMDWRNRYLEEEMSLP